MTNFFQLFGSVKSVLKIDSVCIDNDVFKLHYKVTMAILMLFCILVTSHQYVGEPIHCILSSEKLVPPKALNTYCWINTTHTIPRYFKKYYQPGLNVAFRGVGPATSSDKRTYHAYYQWVCFVLFIQAALFYAPRYLWKVWEGGLLKMLVQELRSPVLEDDLKTKCKKMLVEYFVANLHMHNCYLYKFLLCECLNFINVIAQIYLMDMFLGGEFSTYGLKILSMTDLDPQFRIDPMSYIFPTVSICQFHKYGPSATLQNFDAFCVLPLNVINEKIYIFLWFWFMALFVVTGFAMLLHIPFLLCPHLRFLMLKCFKYEQLDILAKKCQIGDWFLLYQLNKNMDRLIYKDFVADLSRKLNHRVVALSEFV